MKETFFEKKREKKRSSAAQESLERFYQLSLGTFFSFSLFSLIALGRTRG